MPGLFDRLKRNRSKEAEPPPPCTVELPDGWAGGYGPMAFLDAMVKYGHDFPDCKQQAFDRLGSMKGIEGQYLAAAACGPEATMSVNAEEVPAELPLEDALEAFVTSNMEDLRGRDDLIEGPMVATIDTPYPGRILGWSWTFEGRPAESFSMYIFPAPGRLWTLMFHSEAAAAAANEDAFRAIVASFRLVEAPPPA